MRAVILPICLLEYTREFRERIFGADMRRTLSHLRGRKKECLLVTIFSLAGCAFDLISPFIIADMIDTGIPSADAGCILVRASILLALAAVSLVCTRAIEHISAAAAAETGAQLRRSLYNRLCRRGCFGIDDSDSSRWIKALTADPDAVEKGVYRVLSELPRILFTLLGASAAAFLVDSLCGAIFSAALFSSAALVAPHLIFQAKLYDCDADLKHEMRNLLHDSVSGRGTLRALGCEGEMFQRFESVQKDRLRLHATASRTDAPLIPLIFLITGFLMVFFIRNGALHAEIFAQMPGKLASLICLLRLLPFEWIRFVRLARDLFPVCTACEALGAMLGAVPEGSERPAFLLPNPVDAGNVDFEAVSMNYMSGAAKALSNIKLHVRRGQMIGIIGCAGSGKSTLLNLIPRFCDASSGSVRVGGIDVRMQDPEMLRARIGVAAQVPVFFRGSVRENLRFGCEDISDERLQRALEIAQADKLFASKGGLDAVLTPEGGNLSNEEKRRLSIARALARDPDILIIDDSGSDSDFISEARMRLAIRRLEHLPTVFIASRHVAPVRFADRIIVLDDGMIAGIGSHADLLRTCEAYRKICQSQFFEEVYA